MSALPPKAGIAERDWNVRFGPEAEVAVIRAMPVPSLPAREEFAVDIGAIKAINKLTESPRSG